MKKKPIIYFPEDPESLDKKEFIVGDILRIGKPSSVYYQHLYHSLDYNAHQLKDLKALLKLEGVTVKVISILKMRSGGNIAVLHKLDGSEFLEETEKLFANIEKATDTKELNTF